MRNSQKKFIKLMVTTWLIIFSLLIDLSAQERFRRNPPYPEPLPPLKMPPIESGVLSNGLRVITITRLNSPIFTIQILIQAGESDSPPELSGLATVTTQMLMRGTLTLSASEIEERLESLSIGFNLDVQSDYTIFTFIFLEENLEGVLSLIKSFFIEPTFPPLELTSTKRELYYRQLGRNKDPENSGYDFFLKKIFADAGYNPGLINEELIKNISQKDVVAFHQKLIRPNNSIIVFNGNINLNNASRKVSQMFSRWIPRQIEKNAAAPPLENRKYDSVYWLDVPARDVAVIIGNAIMPLPGEDYFPFLVLNQILGGSTSGRLFLNLRESKGLAYYAFSDLSFFKNSGLFWVRARTSPDSIFPAVKESLEQLTFLVEEKIGPLELERAKSYLIGNFPLQIQFPEQFSKRIVLLSVFQLPPDFWNKYYENIMLVSAERVQEVARKYLINQPLIIVAGDINTALDYLKDFDKIDVYDRKGQLKATIRKGVLTNENR
jgi:predicted Zn-dependent peptidase